MIHGMVGARPREPERVTAVMAESRPGTKSSLALHGYSSAIGLLERGGAIPAPEPESEYGESPQVSHTLPSK